MFFLSPVRSALRSDEMRTLTMFLTLCLLPRCSSAVGFAKKTRFTAPANLTLQTRTDLLGIRGGATSDDPVSSFLNAVDLFGTGVFAFSGALTAGKKGMDLLGMIIVATITAVGGGTVRDVVCARQVFWMRDTIYVKLCILVAVTTFVVWPFLEKRFGWKDSSLPICTADAFGLSAFCVLGTQNAADLQLPKIMWVVCGVMTSTFGGIIRDVLCLQRPRIMYPHRSLYATSPLLGSAVYTILHDRRKKTAACIAFLITFFTRVLSFHSPRRLPHWNDIEWDATK